MTKSKQIEHSIIAHKYFKLKLLFLFTITALLISSCGTSRVTGSKINETNNKATKIFVYIESPKSWANEIKNKVESVLNQNNLENTTYIKKELDLNTYDDIKEQAVNFGANRLLAIQLKSSSLRETAYHRSFTIIYAVNLYSINPEKSLWNGEVILDSRGAKLLGNRLEDIINQMKSENLLN